MSDNESYFDETSKSFVFESDKLETSIIHLSQKFEKFSINEIIPLYFISGVNDVPK